MIEEDLTQLREILDRLADVDPADLDDTAVHDATIEVHRLQHHFALTAGQLLAVWDQRQLWKTDQSLTAAGRLSRELHCSQRTAKGSLRRARRLVGLPGAVAVVRAGSLSPDHLDLLAGARAVNPERFADEEEQLVSHCEQLSFRDAEHVVAYWKLHADPDGSEPADDTATAHVSESFDGTVRVDATLDPIGGAIVAGELRRLAEQIRHADERDGVARTSAERLGAALVEMATRSASTPPGSRRPKPLFTVLVGDETLSQLCELSSGHITNPATLARHADIAMLETILFDGPRTVISVSHQRTFTGALRRAIEVRDRHCQHPSGCAVPAERCDVDHIVPWPESQRTDQGNGRLECPTHNRHAERHDTDAVPEPLRFLTGLDAGRARARWWCAHHPELFDDPDDDPD